ncbi:Plant lipid transfer protein/Par allergen [Corchorus capsularis]|uniref:Non-specific lipid-transfer protein n=1 Tax=Corchorus capsularis TaxID=210143 RepID=A0A1R3JI59_COCAP|nr:Plant lipid transfer protein/Par allergen [Corchorus capsularis]
MATAALSCTDVKLKLFPCLSYLQSSPWSEKDGPPPSCCNGIWSLNEMADNTNDRRMACECLKGLIPKFPDIKRNLVESLPGRCKVKVPYRISPSTDCTKTRKKKRRKL